MQEFSFFCEIKLQPTVMSQDLNCKMYFWGISWNSNRFILLYPNVCFACFVIPQTFFFLHIFSAYIQFSLKPSRLNLDMYIDLVFYINSPWEFALYFTNKSLTYLKKCRGISLFTHYKLKKNWERFKITKLFKLQKHFVLLQTNLYLLVFFSSPLNGLSYYTVHFMRLKRLCIVTFLFHDTEDIYFRTLVILKCIDKTILFYKTVAL